MDAPRFMRRLIARPAEIRAVRRDARAFAVEHGVADPDGLALAVTEALNNVALHAYADAREPGEAEVVIEVDRDRLRVVVGDRGRGIGPRLKSPGMGFGLPLMASVCEDVDLQPRPGGGARVWMTFPAPSATSGLTPA